MKNSKMNAQVYIFSQADLGDCVELTFFEGKLDGFLEIMVLISKKEINTTLIFQNAITLKPFKKVSIRHLPNLPSGKINSTQ